ncbi:MAG: Ig-like domain-containing domain, partial [Planctomycetota bacterium]
MRYTKHTILLGALAILAAVPLACGGGGGGSDAKDARSSLVLIDVSVGDTAGVPMNENIVFEFSEVLKSDSIRPDTIQIRQGPNFGKQVPGHYRVDGNRVKFFPRLPVLPDLSDSGLQPGTDYRITLPGAPKVATVRSLVDDRLKRRHVEFFQTADASGRLFTDNFLDPVPPRVAISNPADGATSVPADSKIVLTFNRRPLHPATVTETNIHLTLVERDGIALNRRVPGSPVLTQGVESVQIVWEPDFPLADRATYRLTLERRTQDLVGNDLVPYELTFTTADEPPRGGEVVLEFTSQERDVLMDQDASTASWDDAKPGELAALFTAAGGDGTAGDLNPISDQSLSAEDFPRGVSVQSIDGVDVDVFNFRSIEIPEGVTVRISPRPGGPNRPVALLSLKDIVIDGVLNVQGGPGENGETNTRNSAIPQAAGGTAGPGGTPGASNYTGNKHKDAPRQDADDVVFGAGGGEGGTVSGDSSISYSGGGGGGGAREAGGDGTKGGYTPRPTWNGKGGAGGLSAAERGFSANLERRPNVGAAGGAP